MKILKDYYYSLGDILKNGIFLVFAAFDLISITAGLVKVAELPTPTYLSIIFSVGFLLSSIVTVKDKNRAISELSSQLPYVVSNDNLSLGGSNFTVDSLSIKNIGKDIARIKAITSDKDGNISIVDDHYMDNFILEIKGEPLNLMISEEKIIAGIKNDSRFEGTINRLITDWAKPFYIYIRYENLNADYQATTKIKFQAGDKYIKNLGSDR